MTFHVIVDRRGEIVGISRVGKFRIDDKTEMEAGVIPEEGQTIHELEIPEEIVKRGPTEIHAYVRKSIGARPVGVSHRKEGSS